MPDRPRLVTSGELARALGLSQTTIQRYYKAGLITPALVSAGGHTRWVEDDVREELRKLAEKQRRETDGE